VDTPDHKCYEACAPATFKAKGYYQQFKCPPAFNSVDTAPKVVEVCDDGTTSLRWCPDNHKVNVTFVTKGEAGAVEMLREERSHTPPSSPDAVEYSMTSTWTKYCYHSEDAANHRCYDGCASKPFKSAGLIQPGECNAAAFNKVTSVKNVRQCSDGVSNLKYCTAPLYPVDVTQKVKGEAGVAEMKEMVEMVDSGTLDISFKDCGKNADAVVKSVTPSSMPLGGTTTITGTGQLKKDVTGASFAMKTTGIGGIKLLDCSAADASKPATCPLKAFGVSVGSIAFNGVKFPMKSGAVSGVPSMDVKLPASLPKFATGTTTTLTVTANSGEEVMCVAVTTKAEAAHRASATAPAAWATSVDNGFERDVMAHPIQVGCLQAGKCCLDCRGDCCSHEWHTSLKCGSLHRCD
jgi:hypothetical protein